MRKLMIGVVVAMAASPAAALAGSTQQKPPKNAAQACRLERAAGAEAFKQKYGTGERKSNAFGKCVSQKAKAKRPSQDPSTTPAGDQGQGKDRGQGNDGQGRDKGRGEQGKDDDGEAGGQTS
jgi:hypothetical protein